MGEPDTDLSETRVKAAARNSTLARRSERGDYPGFYSTPASGNGTESTLAT